MQNKIARTYAGLLTQANQASAGVELHGVGIGVTLVAADTFTTKVTDVIMGEKNVKTAQQEVTDQRTTFWSQLDAAYGFACLARDVIKPHLGKKYNPKWDETGLRFSLEVPRKEEKLLAVLLAMASYFGAHPEQQNEALNVLGARATTLYNDLKTARNTLNNKITSYKLALDARNEKMDVVRSTIRALIKDLTVRLDPNDDRWLAFGLNKPGQQLTPPMPEEVLAVVVGPNSVAVKWNAAARATYYRVWKRVVGVDEQLVAVGSPADLDFMIDGLPANSTVEIAVSAVNSGGESLTTKVVTVQIP